MLGNVYGNLSVELEVEDTLCSKGCGRVALPYHAYCKECKAEYQQAWLSANASRYKDYNKDYHKRFKGMYLYMIVDKKTQQIIYIGSSTSIYKRWHQHFNTKKATTFAKWCYYNKINKRDYEMIVLDLSDYDTIDIEELLSLEHELIYRYRDIVINQDYKLPLTPFEIDILERVYCEIDIHHIAWESYQEVITHKKNTSTATTQESILHSELN